MAVILQPSGSPSAQKHYLDTIQNPVDLDDHKISNLLGPTKNILSDIHQSPLLAFWGVVPGDSNNGKYKRMQRGDLVLFAMNKMIVASGKVAHKFENDSLARHLWGTDDKNRTWSLMYSLTDIQDQWISYIEFNRAVGYKENNIIQGFTVLDLQKSNLVLETLLSSDRDMEEVYANEGRIIIREHRSRERDKTLRFGKIIQSKKDNNGKVPCEICGIDYQELFGLNNPLIDSHHLAPLGKLESETRNGLVDLALVCPTCHRALHMSEDCSDLEALRNKFNNFKNL
jgi:predicted HNH restriction endonuclease